MIALTRTDGKPVYVNPDAIKYVVEAGDGAAVVWATPTPEFPTMTVRESAIQVANIWRGEMRHINGAES